MRSAQGGQQSAIGIAGVLTFHHALDVQAGRGIGDGTLDELLEHRPDGARIVRADLADKAEAGHQLTLPPVPKVPLVNPVPATETSYIADRGDRGMTELRSRGFARPPANLRGL